MTTYIDRKTAELRAEAEAKYRKRRFGVFQQGNHFTVRETTANVGDVDGLIYVANRPPFKRERSKH